VVSVIGVCLILSVTIPIAYLLSQNFGFEKVRVNRNVVVSTDEDSHGKIYLLIYQYHYETLGHRNAEAFIKTRTEKGAQYELTEGRIPKDLYLVTIEPNSDKREFHRLAKNINWTTAKLKVFDERIYLVWGEIDPVDSNSFRRAFIKCGQIGSDLQLSNVITLKQTYSPWATRFIEIVPDSNRITIINDGNALSIQGTTVVDLNYTNLFWLMKDQAGHLHFMNYYRLGNLQSYRHVERDKELKTIQENNITCHGIPFLFTNNSKSFVYFMDSKAGVYRLLVHGIDDETVNCSDGNEKLLDEVTAWPPYISPYTLGGVTKDQLFLFFAEDGNYPVIMKTYNISNNYSKNDPVFINWTVSGVHQVGSNIYLVGYNNIWEIGTNFDQIKIEKLNI
jgi:hypothetical protein